MTARVLLVCALSAAAVGVVAAPVPKVEAEPGPTTKAELRAGKKRMEALIEAMYAFHDDGNNCLPSNMTDEDGKPLLSWRVRLLPYLWEEELYKKFDLTQPWDSKANKKLIEEMPAAFAPARRVVKEKGLTFYQGFDGPDAIFCREHKSRIPSSTPDGTAFTVCIVEAGEPVTWTQPVDLPFNAKANLPKLGGVYDGEFWVGMCDGTARLAVTNRIDPDWFKRAVTANDGWVMNLDLALGHSPPKKK